MKTFSISSKNAFGINAEKPIILDKGEGFNTIKSINGNNYYAVIPSFAGHMSIDTITNIKICNESLEGFFKVSTLKTIKADCTNVSKFDNAFADCSKLERAELIVTSEYANLTPSQLGIECGYVQSEQIGPDEIKLIIATGPVPCRKLDFSVNGIGLGEDVITLFVEDLTSQELTICAEVTPVETKKYIVWNAPVNQLLEGRYKDTQYLSYRSSIDGTQKVANGSWNSSTSAFSMNTTSAIKYQVNPNIVIGNTTQRSGDDVIPFGELNVSANNTMAILPFKFDGRFTIEIECPPLTRKKQINLVNRYVLNHSISNNKFNISSDINFCQLSGNSIDIRHSNGRYSFNPVIKDCKVNDVIEIHNRIPKDNSGSKEENAGLAVTCMMCSTSSPLAGLPTQGLTWDEWKEDERFGYNTVSQAMPVKQEIDFGWNDTYKWCKYELLEDVDGSTEIVLSMTNNENEAGFPVYEDCCTITNAHSVSYKDGSNISKKKTYRIADANTQIDAWTLVFSYGGKSNMGYIDGEAVNANTSFEKFLKYAQENLSVTQNGIFLFGHP